MTDPRDYLTPYPEPARTFGLELPCGCHARGYANGVRVFGYCAAHHGWQHSRRLDDIRAERFWCFWRGIALALDIPTVPRAACALVYWDAGPCDGGMADATLCRERLWRFWRQVALGLSAKAGGRNRRARACCDWHASGGRGDCAWNVLLLR